nr:hypothetical protein [Devosia sp.]
MVEGLKHALLDMGAGNGAIVVAIAALAKTGAADAVIAHDGIAGAAAAAFRQTGQEVLWPGGNRAGRLRPVGLAGRCEAENGPVDNGEVRHVAALPFAFRIETGDALAGGRVFDEMLPVPHQLTDIEAILQDAIGTRPAAVQGRGIPLAAARARHSFGIEGHGDLARGAAADIVGKDAAHDSCFALIDFERTGLAGNGTIAE